MKKYIRQFSVMGIIILGFSFASSAQVIVKVRPAAPVVKLHPVRPSPHHVWIDGGWVVRDGRYVWVDGYWARPPRGHIWVVGHWTRRRGGWIWIPGHWVRRR